ncbi:immunoglobulin-like domain-containing protein [Haloplasma contractile]|uniref:Extracellular nuclease protein n=1 Tax=Haloplasma contractile SSD-17B TaxID=1033810 RepID=U2EF85_9MOLU|nr:immunoglobulin-like domain-containing protein [Haloplasma contractile]ERJ13593.1 Extracellular nuclease protein [Haloplasma contractile SSD-17B]
MKKFIALFLTLSFMLVLAACGPNTGELLNEAKEDLNVVYSNGDSADSVTKRVTLITSGINSAIITWESSNTDVIANDGTVTRPDFGDGDAEVTLTATIMKEDESVTKAFDLIVKEIEQTDQEKVDAAKTNLEITFATGDDASSVTSDITLPTEDGDVTISWISAKTDIITNAGVVTRPAYTEDDEMVVLTATLTAGNELATKSFTLTVPAHPMTDADAAEETKSKIIILSNATEATSSFALPTVGANDTVISWTSSNADVIEITSETMGAGIKAKLTRPAFGEDDATITLTATITKNDASVTRTWDIDVPALETAPTTIADFKMTASAGDEFTFTATVIGLHVVDKYKGFYVYDGTESTYIHNGTSVPDVSIGDEVTITGEFDVYHGMPQLAYPNIEVLSSGNTTPDPYVKAFSEFDTTASTRTEYHSDYITLENVFITDEGESYYFITQEGIKYELFDQTAGNEDIINNYVGKSVNINVIVHSYHSLHKAWQFSFVNQPGDIEEVVLTDAEKLANAKSILSLPTEITELVQSLTLPTSSNDVTISWVSTDSNVIALDGTISQPAIGESEVVVTLTATLTVGSETDTKVFEITVKPQVAVTTVTDALTQVDGDVVKIKAIVSGLHSDSGYFIQDVDGTAIYVDEDHYVEVGDEIIVIGKLDTYDSYGNNQRKLVSGAVLDSVVSKFNTTTVKTDLTAQQIVDNHSLYSSQLITLTNVTIKQVDDGYGYTFVETNGSMEFKFKASDFGIDTTTWVDGGTLSVISFNVYDVHYSDLRLDNVTLAEVAQPPVTTSTVTQTLQESDNTVVRITGVVTGLNFDSGYFVQDTDGTAIYVRAGHNVTVGDQVDVTGRLETFTKYGNDQKRLASGAVLNNVVSSNNALTVKTDLTAQQIVDNHSQYSSQLITLTDVIIDQVDDGYGYTFIKTNGSMLIKFKAADYSIDTSSWTDGDTIPVISFNVYDVNYSNLRVVNVTLADVIQP